MTDNMRAVIMTAAALAPLAAWLVVPDITLQRLAGLAGCAVVVAGVVLAIPGPPDDNEPG